MMYIYDPEKIDELLEKIKDDDSVTLTGSQLRELAETIRKKGKGRKPIALDDDLFDRVVRRWQSGEITARAAMQELDLKPNTFYRRVKERYNDMDELRKELKKVAKEEKAELKELRKQVKAEAREVKEAVKDKAEDTISAHKMEKEIRKEKIAAKIDHKKEVDELRKTVEAEVDAIKSVE
jgi:transposase-like protein